MTVILSNTNRDITISYKSHTVQKSYTIYCFVPFVTGLFDGYKN